jgi:hypothetical protein
LRQIDSAVRVGHKTWKSTLHNYPAAMTSNKIDISCCTYMARDMLDSFGA